MSRTMVVIILVVIVLLAAMLIWLNKEMGALVQEAVFCKGGLFQILAVRFSADFRTRFVLIAAQRAKLQP